MAAGFSWVGLDAGASIALDAAACRRRFGPLRRWAARACPMPGLAMLLRSILPLQQISTWQLGAFRIWFSLHDMRRPACYVEHARPFVVLGGCQGRRGSGVPGDASVPGRYPMPPSTMPRMMTIAVSGTNR